jgi:RNA polymerase sigma factor (sigma-70 family)
MHENQIAEQFEANRDHLRAVAFRMLASRGEAEDAVQEAWLRLHRSDTSNIENLRAWLTTVVARVSLDMLRSRQSRREDTLEDEVLEAVADEEKHGNPAHELLLADSVGLALLVVLEKLSPSERLAFVLHDLFDVPFNDIARIVNCSPPAARQLASRARRRVRGTEGAADADFARRRAVAEAFFQASRDGDFEGLLKVLDPDVVNRVDAFSAPPQGREIRGAIAVAKAASGYSRRTQGRELALINGEIGIIVAPQGRLQIALLLTISDDKISAMEIISNPERLAQLDIRVLDVQPQSKGDSA